MLENSEEDHLMNFIKNGEEPTQIYQENIQENIVEQYGDNKKIKVDYIETIADSQWSDIELKYLPYGKFYPYGTHIFIRPAATVEIQSFSTVNEENPYDVQLKLNEILKACVKITYIDGSYGTYKDLIDGDRNTIAIILSKTTSSNGHKIEKKVVCLCADKTEQSIEFIPANYVYETENDLIKDYFNDDTKIYEFPLNDATIIKMSPPTIGLASCITEYVFYKTTESKGVIAPNVPFMLAMQYILAGKGVKHITMKELEHEEYSFSKMNKEHFMFIYETIDYMDFTIKKAKINCKTCGKEMSTPFHFPNGAKSLFIIQNAFSKLIRK
jgi:hypothetical protein